VEDQNMVANAEKLQVRFRNRTPVKRALKPEYPVYFRGLPAKPLEM
jgi:hypothetical protein